MESGREANGKSEYHRGYTDAMAARATETWQLDQERSEVIGRLRRFVPTIGNRPTDEASKLIRCVTGNEESHVACGNDLEETRDRLIHLLGGDTGTSVYDALVDERQRAAFEIREINADAGGFVKALASAVGVEWCSCRVQQTLGELREKLAYLISGKRQSEMVNCGMPYGDGDAVLDAGVIKPATKMSVSGMLRADAFTNPNGDPFVVVDAADFYHDVELVENLEAELEVERSMRDAEKEMRLDTRQMLMDLFDVLGVLDEEANADKTINELQRAAVERAKELNERVEDLDVENAKLEIELGIERSLSEVNASQLRKVLDNWTDIVGALGILDEDGLVPINIDPQRAALDRIRELRGGDDGQRRAGRPIERCRGSVGEEPVKVEFVGQSVKLVRMTDDPVESIASAARVSTQSNPNGDCAFSRKLSQVKLVRSLLKRKHMSTLEFADADFILEVDRAIQQELTRHRLFSFLIESTRWINYLKKTLRFVTKPVDDQPDEAVRLLEELCEICAMVYEIMIELGATRDYARKALPLATASKMRMKGNFRTWLEMLPKRLDKAAHPEIREIAEKVRSALAEACPAVFGDYDESD